MGGMMKRWSRACLAIVLVTLELGMWAAPAGAERPVDPVNVRAIPTLLSTLSDALQAVCGPNECHVDGINNRVINPVLRDGATTIQALAKVDELHQDGRSVSNLAVALASCTNCRSVAVALQAVVIPSTVQVVDQVLSNTVSLALQCTGCTTAAYSHVIVVASSQRNPSLTPAAKAEVRQIQLQLSLLDRSLPDDQLFDRVDQLVAQFDDAVLNGFGPTPRWARTKTDRRAS